MSHLLTTMDAIIRLRAKLSQDTMTEEARRRANHTIIALAEDVSTQDIIRLMVSYRELTLGIREALKIAEKHLQEAKAHDDWVPEGWVPEFIFRELHQGVSTLLCSSVQMTGAAGGHHGPTDV